MRWSLINIVPQSVTIYVNDKITNNSIEQIKSADSGMICNIIEYDGVTPYVPNECYRLAQVPDDAQIGDTGY